MALKRLQAYLEELVDEGIAVAFSGGVDSSLLLAVLGRMNARRPIKAEALTMHTPLQDKDEIELSRNLADAAGIKQHIFTFDPFRLDAVKNNRTDRCYWCKRAIFEQFCAYAKQQGLSHVIDGTNADDLNVYRPGRKALQELGIKSPLAELGITKAEIRRLSAELGLPTASRPAIPCMATRFEYNTRLDNEKIARVYNGETALKEMFPHIRDIRLRVQGYIARLEVSQEAVPEVAAQYKTVAKILKDLGFIYVCLDLEGFRSGSFDVNLK